MTVISTGVWISNTAVWIYTVYRNRKFSLVSDQMNCESVQNLHIWIIVQEFDKIAIMERNICIWCCM